MKILALTLILFYSAFSFGKEFSYTNDLEGWGTWGDGVAGHDPNIGHESKGSIKISTDWGESHTAHYNFGKLKPGTYTIRAFVRAKGVKPHKDMVSFWHFYDIGKGTEDVFSDLNGSYEWRRVEYPITVTDKEVLIWFRLKSIGTVWIDDVSIRPGQAKELSIGEALPFKETLIEKTTSIRKKQLITLLDFDSHNSNHPFPVIRHKKSQVGRIAPGKYYNFDPTKYLNGNWEKFDRIQLDVYNGSKEFAEFYLTLGDETSNNYWSQLNHKTFLAPGWNKLNFSLEQFLGERGSHRHQRPLNLKKIKKMFVVVDPDQKIKKNSNFFIDNLSISYEPFPEVPQNIWAFDFTSQKDNSKNSFIKVTSQDSFEENGEFGFSGPEFWRIEDSVWTDQINRYSIGLLKGSFRVKLPNGKYQMALNFERLGYWDTPFWTNREVYINNKIVLKETRSSALDFTKDFLRFEAITPGRGDHPYDLYLKNVFRPRILSFEVTKGYLNLGFEGDATGISLNSLIIWNHSNKKVASDFLELLDARSRLEFDWMSRLISPLELGTLPTDDVSVIKPGLILRSDEYQKPLKESLSFIGGIGEKPQEMLQLRSNQNINWKVDDLTSSDGQKISSSQLRLYEVVPQFISPDLNHESYFLGGKFVRPISSPHIDIDKTRTTYLRVEIPINSKLKAGTYKTQIHFQNSAFKKSLPIELKVLSYSLPEIKFPVGFFGPDPVNLNHVTNPEFHHQRMSYRHKAIQQLGSDGFTTFSGLPKDLSEINQIVDTANKSGMIGTYYTYGGEFSEDSEVISTLMKVTNANIVHTYSDEASGYSNKVSEDIERGQSLKQKVPSLRLGGFSSINSETVKLNSIFNDIFYSKISKQQIKNLSSKQSWGLYNASPGNLDDPRYSFGPGLFYARQMGLSQYLEWHGSSVNNYPYYDFDGRENDVTMWMPRSNGDLLPTLKYHLAVEGLTSYRKLVLLEKLLDQKQHNEAKDWLNKIKNGSLSRNEDILKPVDAFDFSLFHQQLNKFLADLTNQEMSQISRK